MVKKREPLTRKQLESIKASDLAALKLSEDEKALLKKINQERASRRELRTQRLREEEAPILNELAAIDFKVSTVWDFVNTTMDYKAAIPVLLKHLVLPYSDRIKEGLARSLATKDPKVTENWVVLVEEYRKAKDGYGVIDKNDSEVLRLGAKDGLACAIAESATEDRLQDVVSLVFDETHGESRILLLRALRQSKSTFAKEVLANLVDHPTFANEIASWKSKQ